MISAKAEKFSDKEITDKFFLVTLIEAIAADGKQAFYYVSVWGNRLEDFKRAMEAKKPFDLAEYGRILMAGYGAPTREVIEFVEENFGLKHDDVPRLKMTDDGLKEVPLASRENG